VFDAHFHIIDPRFPLIENEGYLPPPYTLADYRKRMARFDVDGGAVVSGSFQGADQSFLRAALAELGPGWVGVTNLPPDATDEQILDLHRCGVRALRFNLKRAAGDIVTLTQQARRAWDLARWHVELYIDGSTLGSLQPVISKLPALSVDHLGMSDECLPYLLNLVDRGAKVKASGFGRVAMNIPSALRRIHAVNPQALMFGTDLPGIRTRRAFRDSDIGVIADAIGPDMYRVLDDNARAFYGLPLKAVHTDPAPTRPLPATGPTTLRLRRDELPSGDDTRPLPIIE
jgi:predicted TIM-barrel fold metal-dependent hydrolase